MLCRNLFCIIYLFIYLFIWFLPAGGSVLMSVNMCMLCCRQYCRCRVLILSGYGMPSECSDGIFSGSDMVDNQFFALVVEYVDVHVE